MFGHEWVDGEATIVDVHITKTRTGSNGFSYNDREYVADVRVPGAPVFRTVLEEPHIQMDWAIPNTGQVVLVHADVKRQKAKFNKDDPGLSVKRQQKAMREADDAEFHATVAAEPGSAADGTAFDPSFDPELAELVRLDAEDRASGAAAPTPTPAAEDPQARLQKLKQLKDSGLITDAEFAAKRQAIIDSL